MGLFDKIFSKKNCDICGGEIGLLGNRKLEDGNCCKECANKLSPWFDERRHSTVEQIKGQLAYREQNRMDLNSFISHEVIGQYYKMYIEMKNGVPYRFVVSSSDNFKDANGDIVLFSNVSSCNADIKENRREIMRTDDKNEKVSYNPPRYEYTYDFYVKLIIDNTPWFDDMSFKVNSYSVKMISEAPLGFGSMSLFGNRTGFDPAYDPKYREYKLMCDTICDYVAAGQRGVAYNNPIGFQPTGNLCVDLANAVMGAAGAVMSAADAGTENPGVVNQGANLQNTGAEAPVKEFWNCSSCGSENTGRFCQGCGAPKPAPAPVSQIAAGGWTCFCGTVNTGRFCEDCGTPKFGMDEIECSECSWTAEPGDSIPKFCPNCGKRFDRNDIR